MWKEKVLKKKRKPIKHIVFQSRETVGELQTANKLNEYFLKSIHDIISLICIPNSIGKVDYKNNINTVNTMFQFQQVT